MYRVSLNISSIDEDDIDVCTGEQVIDYSEFLEACDGAWWRMKRAENHRREQAKAEGSP